MSSNSMSAILRQTGLLLVLLSGAASALGQPYNIVTVAGTDTIRDGTPAASAPLRAPVGVAVDSSGNLFIADLYTHRIRKVSPTGTISTVAGTGHPGFSGDGGPAVAAMIDSPYGVAVDRNGNLYISDSGNYRIRKVAAGKGIISTVAGNGSATPSGDGEPAVTAGFDPYNVAVDANGNLYIPDFWHDQVRKVTASTGIITRFAGTGTTGYTGDGGPATVATLNGPSAVSVDTAGNIYICDQYNNVIRMVSTNGTISTIVGTGNPGDSGDNGLATQAALYLPDSVSVDPQGQKLYVLSIDRVRTVDLGTKVIAAFAGSHEAGFSGDGGPALSARFYDSTDLAVASVGDVFVADGGNHRVRRIRAGMIDTVAGTDVKDGSLATAAYLNQPGSVAVNGNGDLFIGDLGNCQVRRVSAADGRISTVAGTGNCGYLSGRMGEPAGLALDPSGNLVVADYNNSRVIRLGASGTTVLAGLVGTPKSGFSGDGGLATSALLRNPTGVAYDRAGSLYIADLGNNRVRKVDASTGIITTFAGNGLVGWTGIGGPATQASMVPCGVAFDAAGNLYIADLGSRILKVAANTGIVTVVAGTRTAGYSGDGQLATAARLNVPTGVALDSLGSLYIADFGNYVVRKVTPEGFISTIAGRGNETLGPETGPALEAGMAPQSVSVSPAGDVYIADVFNDRVRKLVSVMVRNLVISGGNNQSGNPSAKLTVSVRATYDRGSPAAGVQVTFTVKSGSASVAPASVLTGNDGIASTVVTLGSEPGRVVVTATSSGLPALTFDLTVNAAVPASQITAGGVVGAGLFPGKRTVAAGGIATVFGQNFAPAGTARTVKPEDLVEGRVATMFAGVCVQVGETRAPVFAVYASQINFQVPAVAAGSSVPVRVITGCGVGTEVSSNAETVSIQAAAPEFFSFRPSADGRNPVAAVNAVTGALIGGAELGGPFTPAAPKDIIVVFGTSFGATDPVVAPGEFPTCSGSVKLPVTVTLNGRELPPADVLYAGVTPGNPGLYQLNLMVPHDTADGDLPIVLTIGNSLFFELAAVLIGWTGKAYLTVRSR